MSGEAASATSNQCIGIADRAQPQPMIQPGLPQQTVQHDGPLSEHVETELVDLTGVSLSMLRECDVDILTASIERMMTQFDRPRMNFVSDPPGLEN